MVKIKTKKTKADNLAVVIANGFKRVDESFKKQEKATDEKIDNLATMTKRGFDRTAKDMDGVKQDLSVVKNDVRFLKNDIHEMKEKITNIEKLILQQHGFQIKELKNKVRYIEEVLTIDK